MNVKSIRLLSLFACLLMVGCKKEKVVKDGCVKAEFLGPTDSTCGGPYKIKIKDGVNTLKAILPQHNIEKGSVITTSVPEQFRKAGQMIYFTPVAVPDKHCLANVLWYIEIQMTNLSSEACQ